MNFKQAIKTAISGRSFIGFVVLGATMLAACATQTDSLDGAQGYSSSGTSGKSSSGTSGNSSGDNASGANSSGANSSGATTSGSPSSDGKTFFTAQVYPGLKSTCAGCHGDAGPQPSLAATDAGKAYDTIKSGIGLDLFTSHSHGAGGGVNPSGTLLTSITQWVGMEKSATGGAPTVSVLDKIGSCMDQTKFNAIGFGKLVTTKRNGENAQQCTGCNQAPCRDCHTGGDANFYMTEGSNLLPAGDTFTNTQLAKYAGKYFTTSGLDPVASNAIKAKSDLTVAGPAYSHPMFTLTPAMQTALTAFTDDAIAKYKAGTCGK